MKYYYLLKGKRTLVVLEPDVGNMWFIERFQVHPPKRMTSRRPVWSEEGYRLPDVFENSAYRITEGAALPIVNEVLEQEGLMEKRRAQRSWQVRGETNPSNRKSAG